MPHMIAAANVMPNFGHRRSLVADDLRRLQDPVVLFEHQGTDSDGVDFYLYTVAGYLDGARLPDGCTVAGEVMLIHADSRQDADALASLGLMDTINALDAEEGMYQEAAAALARLSTVGAVDRIDLATKPASDLSDAFVADRAAIRPLIGDDVILTTGGAPAPTS